VNILIVVLILVFVLMIILIFLDKKNSRLSDNISVLEQAIESQKETIDYLKETHESSQKAIKEHVAQKKEIKIKTKQISILEREVEANTEQISRLQKDKRFLEKNLQEEKKSIVELEAIHEGEIDEITEKILSLEKVSMLKDETIIELQEKHQDSLKKK